MNPIIDRIAYKIEEGIKSLEFIEGIVLYGGFARKSHDYYSDLDLFIYLNEFSNENIEKEIKQIVIEILNNDDEGISNQFEIYNKWIIFTEKTFIKIEIGIKKIEEAKEDIIYIAESMITNPIEAIGYDKNNRVKQIYLENWIDLSDINRLKALFKEKIYKFIYYFERCLANLAKDDEYRAYMNYSLSFYKLAELKAMVEDKHYNLYQPSRFTTDIIDNWDLRNKYYRASAGLRKYDMIDQRDNLKNLFLGVLKKGMDKFNLGKAIFSDIQNFFKKVDEKYLLFKNLRDIALIPNNFSDEIKIKEGLIFRSASLSKNNSGMILEFLKEKKIKHILDIRCKDELENYIKYNNFYDDELKENYVINIPFKIEVNTYIPDKPYENFYYAFLKDFRDELGLIFEKYFSNASKNRLIIHCEGGKDRTGVIIALLLDLLGVDRELILQDYLLSYSDTNRKYIEFIFEIIDNEYIGTEEFLRNQCNVSEKAIQNIKKVLVFNK